MGYNLLINGVYWGYKPLTNLLGHPSSLKCVLGDSQPQIYLFDGWEKTYSTIKVGPGKPNTNGVTTGPYKWPKING